MLDEPPCKRNTDELSKHKPARLVLIGRLIREDKAMACSFDHLCEAWDHVLAKYHYSTEAAKQISTLWDEWESLSKGRRSVKEYNYEIIKLYARLSALKFAAHKYIVHRKMMSCNKEFGTLSCTVEQ